MKNQKYSLEFAKEYIIKNGGVITGKTIKMNTPPGIKILGVLDYLVNHHKYVWAEH